LKKSELVFFCFFFLRQTRFQQGQRTPAQQTENEQTHTSPDSPAQHRLHRARPASRPLLLPPPRRSTTTFWCSLTRWAQLAQRGEALAALLPGVPAGTGHSWWAAAQPRSETPAVARDPSRPSAQSEWCAWDSPGPRCCPQAPDPRGRHSSGAGTAKSAGAGEARLSRPGAAPAGPSPSGGQQELPAIKLPEHSGCQIQSSFILLLSDHTVTI